MLGIRIYSIIKSILIIGIVFGVIDLIPHDPCQRWSRGVGIVSVHAQGAQGCSSTKRCSDYKSKMMVAPAIYDAPNDMTADNTFYGAGAMNDEQSECARVLSIERDDVANVFRIRVALKLSGRGCNKTIPWSVAPRLHSQVVRGADALTRCNTAGGGCTRVDAGPLRGLTIVAPPPVYRARLSSPLNSMSDRAVPFGYTGYQVYETESKGTCAKYGFSGLNTGGAATLRKAGPLGIALAAPHAGECGGAVPQQKAFSSRFSPKMAASRLSTYLNAPSGGNAAFNQTALLITLFELLTNNTAYAAGARSFPYNYVNVAELLGVDEPFACGEAYNSTSFALNTTKYRIGSTANEAHSCPMSAAEWESVLPDVVVAGINVDEVIGPNTTAYGKYERDGAWIVPSDTLGTLPMVCYRCSSVPSEGSPAGGNVASNYASRHMPISMTFGPQCAGLTVHNSRYSTRVALGVYVGISATADPYDGRWWSSVAFPVRYAKAIGSTSRLSHVLAPGSQTETMLNASLTWHKNVDGAALRFQMSALRYILCNGGGAALMNAGLNTTSGRHVGPLMSRLVAHANDSSDMGPAWPNPFRWVQIPGLPECAGCTYPTLASQKGWTIMDAQTWRYGQHNSIGGYHVDHSLWSRIMALVNGTSAASGLFPDGGFNLFAKWNEATQFTNLYSSGARMLNQSDVLGNDQVAAALSSLGILGIGEQSWPSSVCDYMKHHGRPIPSASHARVSEGRTAAPLCWLLRRQLYAQSNVRSQVKIDLATGASTRPNYNSVDEEVHSLPDLASAARSGIFNVRAPNVWFGAWQRRVEDGDTHWHVFMDDTWDRASENLHASGDGMARDAEGELVFEVPIASVARKQGPTLFYVRGDGSRCGGVPTFSGFGQVFAATMAFMSPSSTVTALHATFTPYNCDGTITYNITSAKVTSTPFAIYTYSAQAGACVTEQCRATTQRPIEFTIPYDTVGINVTYEISFEFSCQLPADASVQYGFYTNVSYSQYNTPSSTDDVQLTDALSPPLTLCSQNRTVEGVLSKVRAFDMSNLAPRAADKLPLGYICDNVYLDNPLNGGFHFVDDSNTTIAFDEDARNYVQYHCTSFESELQPGYRARCNISASLMHTNGSVAREANRTGDCHYITDLYMPDCSRFWKLSTCQPWNREQLGFVFSLLFAFGALLCLAVITSIRFCCGRDEVKHTDKIVEHNHGRASRSIEGLVQAREDTRRAAVLSSVRS